MREVMNSDVSDSRNGQVRYMNNALLELTNPKSRHVHLNGRKNNIFATIAETFWVMSGEKNLDPYMSFFLPRAKDFSDNGIDWRGAYGPRIYANEQVQGVIDIFKKEGEETRRAVISIYDSLLDSPKGLKEVYKLDSSKDIPCNNLLHFYIRKGKLNCNAFSRSGDVVWGVTNINIFEWTFLMEYIAQEIGVEVGTYSHFVTNLHIYDFTKNQAEDVLKDNNQPKGVNSTPLVFPSGNNKQRWFFVKILTILSDFISDDSISVEMCLSGVYSAFLKDEVPTKDNLLWDYSRAIVGYIDAKKGDSGFIFTFEDGDFKDSILHSPFRKFKVK